VSFRKKPALWCGAYVITRVMTITATTIGETTNTANAKEQTDTALRVVIP
jgi:hypothetical protein